MSTRVKRKKWPRKNLGELLNFLETFYPDGISLEELAKDIKTTKGSISNMFRRDDMKLSKAEKICDMYGYKLSLFFPVRRWEDGYVPRPPSKAYPNAGNLGGLVKYIQDSEYSMTFVAEKNNMSVTTLTSAFSTGDILLSTLNSVVDTLGICIIWNFYKKK